MKSINENSTFNAFNDVLKIFKSGDTESCHRDLNCMFAVWPPETIDKVFLVENYQFFVDVSDMFAALDLDSSVPGSPFYRFYEKLVNFFSSDRAPDFEMNFKTIFKQRFLFYGLGHLDDDILYYNVSTLAKKIGVSDEEFLKKSLQIPGLRYRIVIV